MDERMTTEDIATDLALFARLCKLDSPSGSRRTVSGLLEAAARRLTLLAKEVEAFRAWFDECVSLTGTREGELFDPMVAARKATDADLPTPTTEER